MCGFQFMFFEIPGDVACMMFMTFETVTSGK